jgi:hypothetical protein
LKTGREAEIFPAGSSKKDFSCFFDITFVKPCGASNDTAAPGIERFAAKA